MNTTENNRIIAEFMGWSLLNDNRNESMFNGIDKYLLISDLKFHLDWNWLMEVVEKIESLSFDVFINTCVCRITDVGQGILEDIETFDYNNKKQAVYNACLEFIKWYNQQKK